MAILLSQVTSVIHARKPGLSALGILVGTSILLLILGYLVDLVSLGPYVVIATRPSLISQIFLRLALGRPGHNPNL